MIPLKYATASQEVPLGYFLDSTNGDTEETGLTIANTDIKLWKAGATTLANKNSGGGTHISNGVYYCTLDATDTNTYGPLVIFVHVSGALTVRLECVVMNADAYDALYAADGTGHIEADAVQISGDAAAADNAELAFDGTGFGFTNCVMPTVTTLTGHTAQTGDSFARIGATGSGLTSLASAADLATVDTVVDGIQTDLSNGTDGLGALKTLLDTVIGYIDTEIATIDSKLNDIQGATFSSATDSLEAIRDRGDAAWTTGAGGSPPQLLQSTTIATLASQTSFTLTAGSADDDAYNGAIAVITDQATSTQKAVGTISDYTGSTKTITLSADPGIFTMAAGDTIEIIAALGSAGSAPTANQVADAVWDEAAGDHVAAGSFGAQLGTDVDAILIDTNSLNDTKIPDTLSLANINAECDTALTDYDPPTKAEMDSGFAALNDPTSAAIADAVWDEAQAGHVGAGSFGEIATEIADILADTNELQTDDIPATLATIAGYIDTEVQAIIDDLANGTDGLGALKALIDTVQADVTSILGDTGTDGVVISAATANAIADALLKRDWNSVSGESARSTLNALRFLRNKWSISGTTLTVTKEDDSTAAWTGTVTTDAAADPVTGNDPA